MRFWFPKDDRPKDVEVLDSLIYGAIVAVAITLVIDVADILLACANATPMMVLVFTFQGFLNILGYFGFLSGVVAAAVWYWGSVWLVARLGARAAKVLVFAAIAVIDLLLLLTMVDGRTNC